MGRSLAERVASLPAEEREAWIATLPEEMLAEIIRGEWWWTARPEQIPPAHLPWLICLALAGRGYGKSRSGSEWMVDRVLRHPFDRQGVPTEWLVVADTLSDARTINAEGPSGLINVLKRRKIDHRYKQSPRPMVLFPDGAKIYLEGADDPDTGRGYNAAGILCVARGEPVATRRGSVPIEGVVTGDQVWTSAGWRRVTAARLTKVSAPVVRVLTTAGSVKVTQDHLVWTTRGWVEAGRLRPGDSLATCRYEMNQLTPFRQTLPLSTSGTGKPGTSTRERVTTTTETGSFSIGPYGSQPMGRSQMSMKSTTSVESVGTPGWRTWSFSRSLRIGASAASSAMMQSGRSNKTLGRLVPGCWPTGSGNGRSPRSATSAMSVAKSSSVGECDLSVAPLTVGLNTIAGTQKTTVVAVLPAGSSDVYDLTVDGPPEFFAGSGFIKIHNCDELAKWLRPYETWYEGLLPALRADLIGDHPRAFVTTTPKPIQLLEEWVSRTDGTVHIIVGSTFENASNLSSQALAEMKLRYEGTVLGDQELYGKLLDLGVGGLFRRTDLSKHRVDVIPEELVSVVVGCDPNLTGKDAHFGIVVVGRGQSNDLYCLADRSVPESGRSAALAVWRACAEFRADFVLYEENLGKRFLKEVLEDAYKESVEQGLFPKHTSPPMESVHAKHGKKTRAEPVAMRSQQGRFHMVGYHDELEKEMVRFDPSSTQESPDRMDAMVHACLKLMTGERKRMRVGNAYDYDFQLSQDLYNLDALGM